MSAPQYQLHHLCIYEKHPRDAMWNWLRWYHAIPAYYWEGYADMHHTGEGGVDYTFLACGAPFQMQLEAPPYQFEYERKWFAEHDSGINHICWIVPNALDTVDHLESNGATVAMPYEEFGGTYNGFVAIDTEGRWVEIMEYVGGFKTPDVEFYPVGHVGLQTLGCRAAVPGPRHPGRLVHRRHGPADPARCPQRQRRPRVPGRPHLRRAPVRERAGHPVAPTPSDAR